MDVSGGRDARMCIDDVLRCVDRRAASSEDTRSMFAAFKRAEEQYKLRSRFPAPRVCRVVHFPGCNGGEVRVIHTPFSYTQPAMPPPSPPSPPPEPNRSLNCDAKPFVPMLSHAPAPECDGDCVHPEPPLLDSDSDSESEQIVVPPLLSPSVRTQCTPPPPPNNSLSPSPGYPTPFLQQLVEDVLRSPSEPTDTVRISGAAPEDVIAACARVNVCVKEERSEKQLVSPHRRVRGFASQRRTTRVSPPWLSDARFGSPDRVQQPTKRLLDAFTLKNGIEQRRVSKFSRDFTFG
eukprot:TRINITY_DN23823_c2_g1_i1.p1 TRINITY_DN23823_c2_g1~~TRINITY_DN23823_c2_g1_i1.p1  ORF type:complete len:292 (+),score=36.18 TRINITY_DN23823_c2_g1_i1:78-953(+)